MDHSDKTNKKGLIPFRDKAIWASCDGMGTLLAWNIFAAYLTYYFTDVVWKQFEDIQVRCTAYFAERLTDLYGEDYMTPPPESKRIAHEITAYWR